MSLIVEAGIVAAFSLSSVQWQERDTQYPYLYVEKTVTENTFLSVLNSSRTNADKIDRFNPKTALWTVSGGFRFDEFTVEVGHQSEHEVNAFDKRTESYNFLKLKYRIEM